MTKPKVKEWTEEENRELLEFIENGRKKGLQIRYLCEQFAQKYPELTREQVRSHYYQLITNAPNQGKTFRQGPWTEEEDKFLFATMKEKANEMNKLEIFEYVGEKLNRNPRAVASHYYNIIKTKKQQEDEEFNRFIANLDKIDLEKFDKLLERLREFRQYTEQEKEMLRITMQLEQAQNEIESLRQQLERANKTIESYKTKVENYRKLYGTEVN